MSKIDDNEENPVINNVQFVPYNDETHRAQLFEMFLEYGIWLNNKVYTNYGVHLFLGGDVKKIMERVVPKFTASKPPEGIIYILEVNGEAAGMGRLSKLEEGVGEVNNMFIRSGYRGMGYGKEMLKRLEEKAREFGFSTLRLDTGDFYARAQHIYRKAGFKEIERYSDTAILENEATRKYYANKVYMEKRLIKLNRKKKYSPS